PALRPPHRHRTPRAARPDAPRRPQQAPRRRRGRPPAGRSPVRQQQRQRPLPARHALPHATPTPRPRPPAPHRAPRHGRHPLKRPTLAITLILALLLGAAHAQTPRIDGIAYAHVSLTITFGGNQAPTYTLEGSIFPRVEWTRQCFPGRCATGMATPLGYWYDPDHFATSPQYHKEEIDHLRQWEAL